MNLLTVKNKIWGFIKSKNIFYALLLLIFFVLDSLHESYPDEFDNILGGWNILHGRLLYIGYFTHHGPFPYFLSAFIEIFSRVNFPKFRIIYALILTAFSLFSVWVIKKSVGKTKNITKFFYFIISLISTYYWFQMLLADTISAFLLIPVFGIVLFKEYKDEAFDLFSTLFCSILIFLTVLSSLTYIYVALIFYAFIFCKNFYIFRSFNFKKALIALGIFISPYLLFVLYLFGTHSFHDYYYDNFVFNESFYIYNYPRPSGSTHINPVRFAVVITHNFVSDFSTLLVQAKDFNFSYPMNITMALGDLTLLIFLLIKKKYKLSLTYFFLLVFSNARSNPLLSAETDYQSAVYIFISLFSIIFVLSQLIENINLNREGGYKFLYGLLFAPIALYSVFSLIFVSNKFFDRYYPKYMGTAPLIYNNPDVAPVLNQILKPTDYYWVGPFEFQNIWYLDTGTPVSKYQILNAGEMRSSDIKSSLISDFENNKPNIVWFDKNFYILGSTPIKDAPEFVDYLDKNYITLYTYRESKYKYISKIPTDRVDLETKLYIPKSNKTDIINRLLQANLIEKVSSK